MAPGGSAPAAAAPAAPAAPSASTHSITLSGSAALVTEFFSYGVNSLLYQRGIYSSETFSRVAKYGLTMLVSADDGVQRYLKAVLSQMEHWLRQRLLRRVVVIFASVATKKVVERWAFDVNLQAPGPGPDGTVIPEKTENQIVSDIRALVRQITASVTFLPVLEEACSFDMLIYTDKDTPTPIEWEESGPKVISEREMVQLRSFSTNVHDVQASVSYVRAGEDS